ncbi:serine/threonine protein kinase [Fusobacterium sp. PH5-44]|uniref:serine/threonine protein kinase n=1 Tax=unclassified Fusobacterium TaxID=2648384 RepID=UPI003D1A41C5
MKKKLYILLVLMSYFIYANDVEMLKNPYAATIIGSTLAPPTDTSKKIPIKEYGIKLATTKNIPDNLWFHDKFKFSLVHQKGPAPLVFLLAGTGSSHNSSRMANFQRILYDAGYHVISIASPFNTNFMVTASSKKLPGILMDDCMDIYNAMEAAYNHVKKKIDVVDFSLVGYSLGGTEAAFVSYIDEQENKFNFKKVYMINPAVDLYDSALTLDSYLGSGNDAGKKVLDMIDFIGYHATEAISNEYGGGLSAENVYAIFKDAQLTDEQMQGLIGLVFRVTAIDINYTADVYNKTKVYVNKPVKKFESTFKYFQKINFASFEDYMNRIMIPVVKKERNMTFEQLRKEISMKKIESYLKTADKIVVVTNRDELILNDQNIKFLEKTFENRLILFPHGGHCGNMYFPENIQLMIKYLNGGGFGIEKK